MTGWRAGFRHGLRISALHFGMQLAFFLAIKIGQFHRIHGCQNSIIGRTDIVEREAPVHGVLPVHLRSPCDEIRAILRSQFRNPAGVVARIGCQVLTQAFATTRICLMPHKFNTSRRHKFAKKKYRVTKLVRV